MIPHTVSNSIYRFALWMVALLLLILLFSCTGSAPEGKAQPAGDAAAGDAAGAARDSAAPPMRLVLGGSEARDSAAIVTEFYVDQAFRAALDSIPAAKYVTINFRDSLAQLFVAEGRQGIPLAEMGTRLDLDGVIFTRIARFSSVLAVETRIIDPANGTLLFRDLSFSMIRYRDSTGTMLLGPTLYDAVRKSVGRFFGVPHRPEAPVATVPMIVANVVIPADASLGLIRSGRPTHSSKAVKGLGELARRAFPELIAFDYQSRTELFKTVGIVGVDDYMPLKGLERQAMFNIGVDRYLTATVETVGDSLRLRAELRWVRSRSADSLLDSETRMFAIAKFQSTTSEDDFVIALIDTAEPLLKREAGRIAAAYERARAAAPARRRQ